MAFNRLSLYILHIGIVSIDLIELRRHLAVCWEQEHPSLLIIGANKKHGFAQPQCCYLEDASKTGEIYIGAAAVTNQLLELSAA
jgi:hypothetical protein